MLIVEYKLATASWDATNFHWKSDDKDFAEALNNNIPSMGPDTPFLEEGVEGEVLKVAKRMFGEELKVILFEPPPVPEEEEGTDD